MTRPLLLWLALCLVAAAGFAGCQNQRSAAFPHRKHVSQLECGGQGQPKCLTCVSCHPGARDPKRSVAATASTCATCHESRKDDVARYFGPAASEPVFRSSTRFDHVAHAQRPGFERECVFCHGGAAKDENGPESFPPMAVCLDCHQADFTEARCVPCHRQERLATLVPQSFMRHDALWPNRHGLASKQRRQVCVQCHSETQCADCHATNQPLTLAARTPDAVNAERVHRGDFLARHAMEARSTPARCLRCHSSQSCDGCHVRRGVSAARSLPTNPHPPGWIGSNPRADNFHGVAARRSLASCAACHDHGPATNCIGCHRVGGYGGSPHRGGGISSRGVSATMCRYCHAR